MANELLPCPFCGGPAEIYNPFHMIGKPSQPATYRGGVRCRACGCESKATTPPDGAITTWNRRADAAPQASAEPVRDAALVPHRQEWANRGDGYGHWVDVDEARFAVLAPECRRTLYLPQADKDGGQQRNWVRDWSAAIKSLPMGRSAAAVDKSPNLQGSSVDRSTDLQGRGDDVVLPPLPSPPVHRGHALFAGSQMQTYARAAVLADRQQRAGEVPSDDALAQIGYAAAIAEVGWGEAWADLESDGDTQQEWRAGAKAIRAALSAPQAEQGERDA